MILGTKLRSIKTILPQTNIYSSNHTYLPNTHPTTNTVNTTPTLTHQTIFHISHPKNKEPVRVQPTIAQSLQQPPPNNLHFQNLTSQNAGQSLDLVSRNFSQFQPLRQAYYAKYPADLTQRITSHKQYYSQYLQEAISNEISTIAYQPLTLDSHMVKSVMFAKDYAFVPYNLEQYMSQLNIFSAINTIYDLTKKALEPQFGFLREVPEQGVVAHFWLGATVSELKNSKILTKLMIQSEKKAKNKGYKYILSWSTNCRTGTIFRNLQYQRLSEVDTRKITIFGEYPFQYSCEENRFSSLWFKPLH